MSTHHKVFKIVLVTGVLALLTAISQWNEHYRMNKLEKALIRLQENDSKQDSCIETQLYQQRLDSYESMYNHSEIKDPNQ